MQEAAEKPVSLSDCVELLRSQRVGGTYWRAQPELPPRYALVRQGVTPRDVPVRLDESDPIVAWPVAPAAGTSPYLTITGECDPWHMLKGAQALYCDAADEVRLIAAVLGIPTYVADNARGEAEDPRACLAAGLPLDRLFANPFGGAPLDFAGLIRLSGFWRTLIDSNRSIKAGAGFAFWKQGSVLPLLWGGGDSSNFFRPSSTVAGDGEVAIWRAKTSPHLIGELERSGARMVEVEDGFLRSAGLGADCVPPLSITVDRLGTHFDPGSPSELENLLEHGQFDPGLVSRAHKLRKAIVSAGLSKYGQSDATIERFSDCRHILVAGQVEDDRSFLAGGSGLATNLELLQRVRALEPDAYLIYKPHPDVVAGHRKGDVLPHIARQFADRVTTDLSISALIAIADEVHVNTSLAGFEALMRDKLVTTHGVPFYSGWGLTRDLGPVPARRTARRSLDELVAATLLLYPRYLDPVSGLPCPAEIVVDRLSAPSPPPVSTLVRLRRAQGAVKRLLTKWRVA